MKSIIVIISVVMLLAFGFFKIFGEENNSNKEKDLMIAKNVLKTKGETEAVGERIPRPCKSSAWQISREFIDQFFVENFHYSSQYGGPNKVFTVDDWYGKNHKFDQVAKFRLRYSAEISHAIRVSNLNDEKLFVSLIAVESGGNRYAKNPNSSAASFGQLTKATARDMGVSDVYDPQQNLDGTAKYLKQMLDTFNGDIDKALLGYYYGPQGAKDAMSRGLKPGDEEYVQKIKYLYANI